MNILQKVLKKTTQPFQMKLTFQKLKNLRLNFLDQITTRKRHRNMNGRYFNCGTVKLLTFRLMTIEKNSQKSWSKRCPRRTSNTCSKRESMRITSSKMLEASSSRLCCQGIKNGSKIQMRLCGNWVYMTTTTTSRCIKSKDKESSGEDTTEIHTASQQDKTSWNYSKCSKMKLSIRSTVRPISSQLKMAWSLRSTHNWRKKFLLRTTSLFLETRTQSTSLSKWDNSMTKYQWETNTGFCYG